MTGKAFRARLRNEYDDLRWAARVLGFWSVITLAWHGTDAQSRNQLQWLGGLRDLFATSSEPSNNPGGLWLAAITRLGDHAFDPGTLTIAVLVLVWAVALAIVFTTLLRAEDRQSEESPDYEFFEEDLELEDDEDDEDDAPHGMPGRRLVH